jgi:radical SAM protein with 4Fe4S-binding SPASM domain
VTPNVFDIRRKMVALGLSPPQNVTLSITNQCNLSCRHCWPKSGSGETATQVPKAAILSALDGFADLGTRQLVITGGEPLTHPDWLSVLVHACNLETVQEVQLQTNATLLTPSHIKELSPLQEIGMIIQVSLEGATAIHHDRVRGSGSYEKARNGLELLIQHGWGPQIRIAFTEMRHNFEDIPELLRSADAMGATRFVTGTLVMAGRAVDTHQLASPTPEQYQRLLSIYQKDLEFKSRYDRIGNIAAIEWHRGMSLPADPCCTFIETPYVTADGRLYPCIMLHADRYAATRIYDRPVPVAISEMLDSWDELADIRHQRISQTQKCQSCSYNDVCGGGCIGRAYAAHGIFAAPEDRCALRQAIYSFRA